MPPRSRQKLLSFVVGWLCTLGWQSGVAIGSFLAAIEIQGLVVLNNDSYVYERWHGTLLTIAIVLFVAFFNTFLAKHLLVEAESARVERQTDRAASLYERALEAAREQQNPLLEAVVGLIRSLGAQPMAEGVETEGQRTALLAMGCTLGQGFRFSPAVPAEEFERLVRSGSIGG